MEVVMRLDKFLSHMGLGTRTEVKKAISRGRVTVNGEVTRKVGHVIKEGIDHIEFNEQEVTYQAHVYLMLNKPKDVISATEDKRHKTVIDLVKASYGNRKLFPVGRLDIDTEGLILLTDDGAWNHQLMSPKKHVSKSYYAQINGPVTEDHIDMFSKGLTLSDGTQLKPGHLSIIKSDQVSEIILVITEGKYHQVKRMFEHVGLKVTYLRRDKIGGLSLDPNLELGSYRELTEDELKKIKLED